MPTYKYKNEEAHQRHLAKRRAYYAQNLQRIREQNRRSAAKRRAEAPEISRNCAKRYRAAHSGKNAQFSFSHNPDKEKILEKIIAESEGKEPSAQDGLRA